MRKYWRSFLKIGLHGVITITVAIAIVLSIARYYTPLVAEYRESLVKWLNLQTGKPVHIASLNASWRGLGPVIDIDGLVVGQQKIAHLILGFHVTELWAYWRTKTLIPRTIAIDGMELTFPFQEKKASTISRSEIIKWLEIISPVQWVTINNLIVHTSKTHLDHLHLDFEQYDKSRHLVFYRKDVDNDDMNFLIKAEDKGYHSQIKAERGSIYFKLNNFDVARYAEIKELLQGVHEGKLSTESWLELKGYQPSSAIGTVRLLDTEITNQAANQDTMHIELATHYAWSATESGWVMTGDKLQLTVGDVITPNSQFRVNYSVVNNQPQYELLSSFLVLDGLGELISTVVAVPDSLQSALQQTHLHGHLSDASLHLAYSGTDWKYHFNGHFYELAIAPSENRPGISGLEAIVQADEQKGKVSLLSRDLKLIGDQWFLHPLHFEEAVSTIDWQHDNELWKVNIPELKLVNQDLDLDAYAEFVLASHLEPNIQFSLNSHRPIDLAVIKEYLPDKLLSPSLDSWLHHGFQQGQAKDAQVIWKTHGGHENSFFAEFNLIDATINYNQRWPLLNHANGHVVFANKRLDIQIDNAQSEGLFINEAHVAIPDMFAKPQTLLTVEGKFSSDLAELTPYLQHTPLWPTLKRQLSVFTVKGKQQTQLAFQIDLQGNQHSTQVDGQLHTHNANLRLPQWHADVENLNGTLHFTESTIDTDTLNGKLLGHPIHISIGSKQDESQQAYTSIQAQFHLQPNEINHFFPNDWLSFFHGQAAWHVEWRDYAHQSQIDGKLIIRSNLKGISSDLPYPLDKDHSSEWPFKLEWDGIQYDVSIQHRLAAQLKFPTDTNTASAMTGLITLGENVKVPEQLQSSSTGLVLSAKLPKLDLDVWRTFLNQNQAESEVVPQGNLRQVYLSLDEMNFHRKRYHNVVLSAKPSEQNQWEIQTKSKEIEGNITIPHDESKPVVGEFSRCHFAREDIEDPQDEKPNDMISLRLHCSDTWYQERQIGDLKVSNIVDQQGVLHMNEFTLKATGYQIDAVGDWRFANEHHESTLIGTIKLIDLAKLLKAFAIKTEIEDSAGEISFDFSAKRPLFNMGVKDLAGHFKLDLKQGRIVALQSSVGHVISLFSFQDIERRLRLDFSDVFKEGFSFDTFKGNFVITDGITETKDTEINGSSAYMKIIGKTNIADESFDLMVDVMPHVTGTLPIAAAVATGNPAIGAVVWVADKIISPSFRQIAKYQYHVTGPWQKPKVDAVSTTNQSSS